MHTMMRELHKDHINLASLLSILNAQVDLLAQGEDADFWLMTDIADYMGRYADAVHHPREDEIYHVLARYEVANSALEKLLAQHQTLPHITLEFQTLLKQVLNGSTIIKRAEIESKIRTFIAAQQSHMDLEESLIFPLIDQTLTASDWTMLEQDHQGMVDPLFGVKSLGRYDKVYHVLYEQVAA